MLLFLLFLCGDMSVVSLIMVLVRKRYFRIHCSELLKGDYFRRTNTVMPDRQSAFSKTFTLNPASPSKSNRVKDKERNEKLSKREISSPKDARALGSYVPDEVTSVDRTIQESPLSFQRQRSRVSFRPSIEISAAPQQANGSMDGPTVQGSVKEEEEGEDRSAVNGPTPSTGLSHARTIQISDTAPTRQYQARQRIRSQSRAMSLGVGPSPKTMQTNIPLDSTKTMPSPLPRPEGIKNSGMGGFPTASQLLPYLLSSRTRSTIHRHFSRPNLERETTMLTNPHVPRVETGEEEGGWSAALMSGVAKWMPDTLTHLVVGRNSRFFTEELDDEELEQIGGVEYRALRLLSYAVSAVCPNLVSKASSANVCVVHLSLPDDPICHHCHLPVTSWYLGCGFPGVIGCTGQHGQQDLVLALCHCFSLYRDWPQVGLLLRLHSPSP